MIIECEYCDNVEQHTFPDDWQFGGANNLHPAADRRWKATLYIYIDEDLDVIHETQSPLCDGQAIDEFRKVRSFGPSFKPAYLQAVRPGDRRESLRYVHDWRTGVTTYQPPPEGDEHGSSAQES